MMGPSASLIDSFRMHETGTARIALDDKGIVTVRIHRGARQRPADARENLAAARQVGAGRRRPLLVDISGSEPLDAETRHLYTGSALPEAFSAVAILVEATPLGHMMGNVYLRVARLDIPARLFTDETRAITWLKRHVD